MAKLLLMYSNERATLEHIARLRTLSPEKEVIVIGSVRAAAEHAVDAEIILGHRYLHQALPHTQGLKWVQSTAAGVHHLLSPILQQMSPILTRCPIFADVIALHAFTLALTVARRVPQSLAAQANGIWQRPADLLPLPKTAMILGMGTIGRALSAILRANRIAVLGVNRRKTAEISAACDELLDYESWHDHLHRVDLLFVALPLASSTRRLVNATVMQALPPHAVIINVGRGGTVDLPALVKRLETGQLGGAALDVLDPLPQSNIDPLWSTPNLLITAKAATFFAGRQERFELFVEDQLRRYESGIELLHQVDIDELLHDLE